MSSIDELREQIRTSLNFHQGDGKISIPIWQLLKDLKDFGVQDINQYIPDGNKLREFLESMGCHFADEKTIFTDGNETNNPAVLRHMKLMRDTPGSKPPPHPSYRKPSSNKNFSNWSKVETTSPIVCHGDSSAVLKESLFYPYRSINTTTRPNNPPLQYAAAPRAPGAPLGPRFQLSPSDGPKITRVNGVGNLTYDSVTRFVAYTGQYEQPRKFAPNTFGAELQKNRFKFPVTIFDHEEDEDDYPTFPDFSICNKNLQKSTVAEEPVDDPHLLHPKRASFTAVPAMEKKDHPQRRFTSPLRVDEQPKIVPDVACLNKAMPVNTESADFFPPGRNLRSFETTAFEDFKAFSNNRNTGSLIAMEAPHQTSSFPINQDFNKPPGRYFKASGSAQNASLFPEGRNLEYPTMLKPDDLSPEGENLKNPEFLADSPVGVSASFAPQLNNISSRFVSYTSNDTTSQVQPSASNKICRRFTQELSMNRQPVGVQSDNLMSDSTTFSGLNVFSEGHDMKSPTLLKPYNPGGNNSKSSLFSTNPSGTSISFVPQQSNCSTSISDYTSDGTSSRQSSSSNGNFLGNPPSVVSSDVNSVPNPFPGFAQYNIQRQASLFDAPPVVQETPSLEPLLKKEIKLKELAYQHPPMTTHQISFKAANLLSALLFDPDVDQMTKDFAQNLFGELKPSFALWRACHLVNRQNASTLVACQRFLCSDSDRCFSVLSGITVAQYNSLPPPKRFFLGRRYLAYVESRGVVRVTYSCAVNDSNTAGIFIYADFPIAKVQAFNFNRLKELPRENVFLIPNIVEWFEPDVINFKEKDIVTIFPTDPPKILYERTIYPCKIYKTNVPMAFT